MSEGGCDCTSVIKILDLGLRYLEAKPKLLDQMPHLSIMPLRVDATEAHFSFYWDGKFFLKMEILMLMLFIFLEKRFELEIVIKNDTYHTLYVNPSVHCFFSFSFISNNVDTPRWTESSKDLICLI